MVNHLYFIYLEGWRWRGAYRIC